MRRLREPISEPAFYDERARHMDHARAVTIFRRAAAGASPRGEGSGATGKGCFLAGEAGIPSALVEAPGRGNVCPHYGRGWRSVPFRDWCDEYRLRQRPASRM